MSSDKEVIKSISFEYRVNKDNSIINDRIGLLLNTNNLVSDQMRKLNIYRTEFYNLFHESKTKWLIENWYVRLYIREDYEDKYGNFTHYIPIGIISNTTDKTNNINNDEYVGQFDANIYPDITEKFKDLFNDDGSINTDKYSVGYISCGNDIIAITLKHLNNKFETKDAFTIYCNKLLKFANKYIEDHNLL